MITKNVLIIRQKTYVSLSNKTFLILKLKCKSLAFYFTPYLGKFCKYFANLKWHGQQSSAFYHYSSNSQQFSIFMSLNRFHEFCWVVFLFFSSVSKFIEVDIFSIFSQNIIFHISKTFKYQLKFLDIPIVNIFVKLIKHVHYNLGELYLIKSLIRRNWIWFRRMYLIQFSCAPVLLLLLSLD